MSHKRVSLKTAICQLHPFYDVYYIQQSANILIKSCNGIGDFFYSDRICTDSRYNVNVICSGLVVGSTGACEKVTIQAVRSMDPFPNNETEVTIGVCRNPNTGNIMKCVSAGSNGGEILLFSWEHGRCGSYTKKTIP